MEKIHESERKDMGSVLMTQVDAFAEGCFSGIDVCPIDVFHPNGKKVVVVIISELS